MARITSTSVVFGDNSVLSGFYDIMPKGSVTLFYQSFTPLGWTLITNQNDKTLRVVSGAGGGQGGSRNFSELSTPQSATNFTTLTGSIGNTTLSLSQLPVHSHITPIGTRIVGGSNIGAGRGYQLDSANFTSGDGSGEGLAGGSHGHPFSNQSVTYSYNFNFDVTYVNVLLASFN